MVPVLFTVVLISFLLLAHQLERRSRNSSLRSLQEPWAR